jgi:hypothetical protein
MINLAAVETFDPPEPEIERQPYADANLIERAEASRLAALHHVARARVCLAKLADVLRAEPGPEGDEAADGWADLFEKECEQAGTHIAGLRAVRECRGEG